MTNEGWGSILVPSSPGRRYPFTDSISKTSLQLASKSAQIMHILESARENF